MSASGQEISIIKTVTDLRIWRDNLRAQGLTLAYVPTMGALHEGHLELVRQGLQKADRAVVSIFVNPTQFAPGEDFLTYPRTWEADLEKLQNIGAHAVFHPPAREMYPPGFATSIAVKDVSAPLEGVMRPGHFDGVATVVAKLLLQALPEYALFGEKDYQQLQVIRRLVSDLNIPVEIIGVPTMRDAQGLALSSRNAYLSAKQTIIAARLNKILFIMADKIRRMETVEQVEEWGHAALQEAGFDSIDYLSIVHAENLGRGGPHDPLRVLAAVRLGKTRLIDNVPVVDAA